MCVNRKQLCIMGFLIPAKYSLTDSFIQQLQENNPSLHDLGSLSQWRITNKFKQKNEPLYCISLNFSKHSLT